MEYLEQIAQMNEKLMRKMEAEALTVLPKPATSLRQIAREESKPLPPPKPEPIVAKDESDSAYEDWETTPAMKQKESSSSEDEWDVTPATASAPQMNAGDSDDEWKTTPAVKQKGSVGKSSLSSVVDAVIPSVTVSHDWSDESDDMWSDSPKKKNSPKDSPKKTVPTIPTDSKPTPSITVSKEEWSDESDDMWSDSPKKKNSPKDSPKKTVPTIPTDSKPTPSITVSKEEWSDESNDMWSNSPKESSRKTPAVKPSQTNHLSTPPAQQPQWNDIWSDEETATEKDNASISIKPLPKSRRRQRTRSGIRGVGKIVNELTKEEGVERPKKDDQSEDKAKDDWSPKEIAWDDEPSKRDDWSDDATQLNDQPDDVTRLSNQPVNPTTMGNPSEATNVNASSDPFSFFDFSPVPNKEETAPKEEPPEESLPEETSLPERIQRVNSRLDSLPDLTFLRNEVSPLPLPHS